VEIAKDPAEDKAVRVAAYEATLRIARPPKKQTKRRSRPLSASGR